MPTKIGIILKAKLCVFKEELKNEKEKMKREKSLPWALISKTN